MNIRGAITLAALAIGAGFATPASGMEAECLAVGDAARLAATQDPRIDGRRAQVRAAQAEFREAQSLRRPQLSLFARPRMGDAGLTNNRVENQVGVELSQRLFDFGDARLAQRSTRASVEAREYDVQAAQINAARQAAMAALGFAEAEAKASLARERIAYFADLRTRLERLLDSGSATRDEVAAVSSRESTARAELVETELARARSSTELEILIGRAATICSAVGESDLLDLLTLDPAAEPAEDASAWRSPALEALRMEVRAARAELDRQRRARLPAVDLVAAGSYVYDDFRDDWELRDRVGFDVSVPLYVGGRLAARSERAAANAALAESELALLERRMQRELRSSVRQIRALRDLRRSRRVAADEKRNELEAIEIAFGGGQRTLFELLDARLGLSMARNALLEVEFDLYREYVRMAALSGAFDMTLDPVQGAR